MAGRLAGSIPHAGSENEQIFKRSWKENQPFGSDRPAGRKYPSHTGSKTWPKVISTNVTKNGFKKRGPSRFLKPFFARAPKLRKNWNQIFKFLQNSRAQFEFKNLPRKLEWRFLGNIFSHAMWHWKMSLKPVTLIFTEGFWHNLMSKTFRKN